MADQEPTVQGISDDSRIRPKVLSVSGTLALKHVIVPQLVRWKREFFKAIGSKAEIGIESNRQGDPSRDDRCQGKGHLTGGPFEISRRWYGRNLRPARRDSSRQTCLSGQHSRKFHRLSPTSLQTLDHLLSVVSVLAGMKRNLNLSRELCGTFRNRFHHVSVGHQRKHRNSKFDRPVSQRQ